ncbi:WD repeat-containing protein 19-like isoform X2 [Clytia hemisphaerica]|uniref:WD repeat-containing protein 19 n=1 Tax=Clytia hemisphaerica TaxID=252671 RepID=A0A7M6DRU9_9CNID
MKRVFTIPERVHGSDRVTMAWQNQQGNFLAVTGVSRLVTIYDRHGELKDEVILPGVCTGISWDKDGDTLAIGNQKTGMIYLWDANTMKTTQLESGLRDSISFLLWSKNSQILAVGTNKGNLLLYNHQTQRKIPVLGKHARKISCGCWNSENLIALAGEDRLLSISNSEGDTVKQTVTRLEPNQVQFSVMKTDERSVGETTLSLTVGQKTLFLYNLNEPDNPIELAFQPRYGTIVTYKWFGDGYIMIGFSTGYLVVISTHLKEIGQELFQTRDHKDELTDIDISLSLKMAASCGDGCIKLHDLNDLKEIQAIINVEDIGRAKLDKVQWTEDGQLLAVTTTQGAVHVYLTKLPILGASYETKVAYLTSLREITITDEVANTSPIKIPTQVEPNFIALYQDNLACGMNNRVWFCKLAEFNGTPFHDREYLGTVNQVRLNKDYAAVGFEGRAQLHLIQGDLGENSEEEREGRLFPDEGDKSKITSFTLTGDFFIYSNEGGHIKFFYLEDWQYVNEYRHVVGIRKIFPDEAGTKVIYIDDKSDGFIYCTGCETKVSDGVHEIQSFPPAVKGVLWDQGFLDENVFCVYDEDKLYLYSYSKDTVAGTDCALACSAKLSFGYSPVMMHNGRVTCQTQAGKLMSVELIPNNVSDVHDSTKAKNNLKNMLTLKRFKEAWTICEKLKTPEHWEMLAEVATRQLDINFAIRVYRHIGNVSMVIYLEKLKKMEDKNLLAGYVAMTLKDFNLAQDLFLLSGRPQAALEMRRDLLHWDQALELAKALAPEEMPFISKEYAQQLEFTGDYPNALLHFENGITNESDFKDHDEICTGGVARMAIRMGDIRRGVNLASKSSSKALKKECASLLENMKQYNESAILYEKSQSWDKAASVYIKLKQWNKVGELLKYITTPKLLMQYAKAKEHDGKYKEAATAYKKAKDYESVIRINLDHLQNPEEAVNLVKETQSVEGARMVAKFFQDLGDFASAIQFLVMSKCADEAFKIAQQYDQMEQYAEIIGDQATQEDNNSIAVYFENKRKYLLAGKFFMFAGQYQKALSHLLRCPVTENGESVELSIQTVKKANDEKLIMHLIDFLMGELDGMPKDSKYLFRLYMAIEKFTEAAKTAIIIAQSEQEMGNYRNAHDVLFSMYKELRERKIKIPNEMNQNLMLLHSYIVCKIHIKRGDHLKGARMLIRVANNISKFPAHIVPILTSTVVECHRAGLKHSSFSFAAMLMRPEYRSQIDVKYKKKIEMIVRKPDKTEEEEPLDACPFCSYPVPQTQLDCPECKQHLPYCVVTGRHMLKDDWCNCPNCSFPALSSEFKK